MIDITARITALRLEREWSEYQLAELSGITQSTISAWTRQNAVPSITNLEKICKAFGITLSQFFLEDATQSICLTKEQAAMLNAWNRLTPEQQTPLLQFLQEL